MMCDHEKSGPAIVAVKLTNKARQLAAERRAGAEGKASQQSMAGLRAGKPCHRRWSAYGTSREYSETPSHTRGERSYGARGNSRPYRERTPTALKSPFVRCALKTDRNLQLGGMARSAINRYTRFQRKRELKTT